MSWEFSASEYTSRLRGKQLFGPSMPRNWKISLCTGDCPRKALSLIADAFGEGARALPCYIHKARVVGDLIQHWNDALGFRQQLAVQVGFELQQRIIDAQAIVLHPAFEGDHVFLLPRQPLEDLHQLVGEAIERVIELGFVRFLPFLIAERLLAQVGDAAAHVELYIFEMVKLLGQLKHLGAERGADFEGSRRRIFIELADFKRGGVRGLVHLDFDEFGCARLEDAAIGQCRAVGLLRGQSRQKRKRQQPHSRQKTSCSQEFHRAGEIRAAAVRVARAAGAARLVSPQRMPSGSNRACTLSAWTWQTATASASAASAGSGVSVMPSTARTMSCICSLLAWP